jgi:hypothetical protein
VICLSSAALSAPPPLLQWSSAATSGHAFSARTYGACAVVTFHDDSSGSGSKCIMYHGGRASPSSVFGETLVLHLKSPSTSSSGGPCCRWQLLTSDGPRLFRHSMVALEGNQSSRVLAIGGLGAGAQEGDFISVWSYHSGITTPPDDASSSSLLSCISSACTWQQIATKGDVPPALHSHTTTLMPGSGSIVLIGGASDLGRCSRHIYTLDTKTWFWKRSTALLPKGLMSHSSTLRSRQTTNNCNTLLHAPCCPTAE